MLTLIQIRLTLSCVLSVSCEAYVSETSVFSKHVQGSFCPAWLDVETVLHIVICLGFEHEFLIIVNSEHNLFWSVSTAVVSSVIWRLL